jgi:hypothetical protein
MLMQTTNRWDLCIYHRLKLGGEWVHILMSTFSSVISFDGEGDSKVSVAVMSSKASVDEYLMLLVQPATL